MLTPLVAILLVVSAIAMLSLMFEARPFYLEALGEAVLSLCTISRSSSCQLEHVLRAPVDIRL